MRNGPRFSWKLEEIAAVFRLPHGRRGNGEDLLALGVLVVAGARVGKQQLFADIAPEQVLDEAHRLRLGADEGLGIGDELLVLLRDAFE